MSQPSKYLRKNLRGLIHDSLEIVEPSSDVEVFLPNGKSETRRQWWCKCKLCGQPQLMTPEDLLIQKNEQTGLYTSCSCDCHKTSSFEWQVMLLFRFYKVRYDVRVPIVIETPGGDDTLRFNFCLYDSKDKVAQMVVCHDAGFWAHIGRDKTSFDAVDYETKKKWCADRHIVFIGLRDENGLSMEDLHRRLLARGLPLKAVK